MENLDTIFPLEMIFIPLVTLDSRRFPPCTQDNELVFIDINFSLRPYKLFSLIRSLVLSFFALVVDPFGLFCQIRFFMEK